MRIKKTLPNSAWGRLGDYLRETQLLASIHNTLYWDQNTIMPYAGSAWRGEQLSFMAKKLHSRQSSKEFEELINAAKQEFITNDLDEDNAKDLNLEKQKNIELLEQDFNRQKRLDPELVVQLASAQAKGYNLWQQAKAKNDFSCFAPALKKLISLRQEQAMQLNEDRSCWETLAQPFEPDLTISRMKELFAPLKKRLPEILEKVRGINKSFEAKWDLQEHSQQLLCDRLLNAWGIDTKNSAIARSPHPFSITLGPNDFRITTRVVSGHPLSCFLATAHEWGHSLYEQGLPSECHKWFAWPSAQATSMGVHESQSLFWENRVARSRSFSEYFWRHFVEAGAPLKSGLDLWKAMNPLSPGPNRVEADEVSYGLHILIRTELEIALLEDGLSVEELPYEWNKRYKDLLGVIPKNDAEGCLQDVHWSEGSFGYFPSYLLGHIISAQLTRSMEQKLGSIDERISLGDVSSLLTWLRENVHHFGRKLNGEQLVKEVTGEDLNAKLFLHYLESKVDELSSLT